MKKIGIVLWCAGLLMLVGGQIIAYPEVSPYSKWYTVSYLGVIPLMLGAVLSYAGSPVKEKKTFPYITMLVGAIVNIGAYFLKYLWGMNGIWDVRFSVASAMKDYYDAYKDNTLPESDKTMFYLLVAAFTCAVLSLITGLIRLSVITIILSIVSITPFLLRGDCFLHYCGIALTVFGAILFRMARKAEKREAKEQPRSAIGVE